MYYVARAMTMLLGGPSYLNPKKTGIHENIKNAQNKICLRKIKAGKWATR